MSWNWRGKYCFIEKNVILRTYAGTPFPHITLELT